MPAGLKPEGGFAIDEEILLRVAPDAPERPLFAPKSWETRSGGTQHLPPVRINDQDIVPDARQWWTPNFCAALLMPDNRTVRHLAPLCRPEPGGPVFAFDFGTTDLFGDGIRGSHGASRMSALGGSVRLGELTGAGPIRHALKCCLFAKRYCYFGDDRKGYRWPAAGADSYADKDTYSGSNRAVVMGSLLALPPDVDLSQLQTPVGRKLAAALRDYGCYIVDDAAHDVFYLCAERGVEEEAEEKFGRKLSQWPELLRDIHFLLPMFAVVDNNAPDRIGGGGRPRAPLAPPLADAPQTPPPKNKPASPPIKITVKNPSMTDGKDVPEHWTNQWIGHGKIKVMRDKATYRSAPASLAIEALDGPAHAQVSQFFEVKGGQRVKLSGWLRADGGANAMLAVQSFSADWKGIELKVVGNALTGFDWRRVEGDVVVPAGVARAAVVLMLQGPGIAWFDDVSLDGSDPGAGAEPQAAARPKPSGPPKPKHSCDPAEGFYPDYPHAWRQIVDGQLKRAKEGPAAVVFLGDSLTLGWNEQPHWKEHYLKFGTVNFGVGGDGTPQVLWRIDHGILDGLNPRVVVLCIGINNLWLGYDAADTVKGVEAVLQRLNERCPGAKVLLLGNTHFFDKGDGKSRRRVRDINAALAKLADGRRVNFVNFSERLLTDNDELKPEMYASDKLHLSAEAYAVWAKAIDPVLEELLNDHK